MDSVPHEPSSVERMEAGPGNLGRIGYVVQDAADASTSNSPAGPNARSTRQLFNTLSVPPTLVEQLEQLAGDSLRLCRLRLRLLCHPRAHGSNSLYRIKKKSRTWEARLFSSFSSFLAAHRPPGYAVIVM